jgi:hypothetical protein
MDEWFGSISGGNQLPEKVNVALRNEGFDIMPRSHSGVCSDGLGQLIAVKYFFRSRTTMFPFCFDKRKQ